MLSLPAGEAAGNVEKADKAVYDYYRRGFSPMVVFVFGRKQQRIQNAAV